MTKIFNSSWENCTGEVFVLIRRIACKNEENTGNTVIFLIKTWFLFNNIGVKVNISKTYYTNYISVSGW